MLGIRRPAFGLLGVLGSLGKGSLSSVRGPTTAYYGLGNLTGTAEV